MKAVIIYPKDRSELKLVNDLLNKLGIRSLSVDQDELEDLALSRLLKKVDKTKKASKAEIMKKLHA